MKKLFSFILLPFFAIFIITSCEKVEDTGTLNLSITDAPIDNSDIVGVWLTITEIQYHKNDQEWKTFDEFEVCKLYLRPGKNAFAQCSFALKLSTF